jgi:hypothetical protein
MALSKAAKIGIIVAGIPVFLILAATVFAKLYFTSDRLKAMVLPPIIEATHREVTLRNISLSVFPTIAVSIESLAIGNPQAGGFESAEFISLPELRINMSLLPLLSGKAEVGDIILDHPRITMEVTPSGLKNFKFDDGKASAPPAGKPSGASGDILVGNFQIRGGVLEMINRKYDSRMLLDGLDQTASMEAHRGENAMKIHGTTAIAKFSYGSLKTWYLSDQPVTAREELTYAIVKDVLTFDATDIKVRDLPLTLSGSIADLTQKTFQMDLALKGANLTMQQLLSLIPPEQLKAAEGMTSTGDVGISMTIKGPSSETVSPATRGEFTVANGTVRYAGLPKAITGIAVRGTFEQPSAAVDNKDIGSFRINQFGASLGTQQIGGKLAVDNFNNPLIDATVNGLVNLDEVKEFYPLEKGTELHGVMKANIAVSGRAKAQESLKANGSIAFQNVTVQTASSPKPLRNLQGTITFNNQVIESKQLAMNIGESDLNLAFTMKNYLGLVMKDSTKSGGSPSATMTLTSKQLRTADLMPSEPAAPAKSAKAAPAGGGFGLPPGLKVNANVAIDKLVTEKFTFTNARGQAAVADGVVRMNDFSVNAFDGTIKSKGMLDLRDPKKSPFDFDLDIRNVESSAMLPSFTSFGKYLFGKFSTTTALRGDLNDTLGLDPQSLLGKGTVNMSDGKLVGLPMMEKLAGLINISELRTVNFKDWSNAFAVENGRLTVKDLKVNAGQTAFALDGSQGLDGSLNYGLTVKLPESMSNRIKLPGIGEQMLQFFKDKDGRYSLSFNVGGMMASPSVGFNAKAQEDLAKQALEAQKQKLLDDAKKKSRDELKKKLGEGLKNLLKKP